MIYSEGLMHRKINIWIALLAIIIVAASAAWVISAQAIGSISFGGIIVKVDYAPICGTYIPCILAGGCLPCGCGQWDNIIFVPFGGDTFYVCPPVGFPYLGVTPIPMPGMQILGWGMNERLPIQIGLSL